MTDTPKPAPATPAATPMAALREELRNVQKALLDDNRSKTEAIFMLDCVLRRLAALSPQTDSQETK